MKKITFYLILISVFVLSIVLTIPAQRYRYDTRVNSLTFRPGSDKDINLITVAVTGDPVLHWDEAKDSFETNKGMVIRGTIVRGLDIVYALKTVIKTISIDNVADDFQFNITLANVTEQPIDLGPIIPAYAEIVSAQIRCFEALVSSAADPDDLTSLDLGISSGGNEILATATTDDINDINVTAAGTSPELAATNAARNVWFNLIPEDNFNTLTAGRWAVIITYIDNDAVYVAEGP